MFGPMLFVIGVLLLLVVAYVLLVFKAPFSPDLPTIPGSHWLFGDLAAIRDHNGTLNDWIVDLMDTQFKGKSFQLRTPMRENVFIIMSPSAENAEWLLKGNFDNYKKDPKNPFEELFGKGIFAVDGAAWRSERKSASHMFSTRALRDYMVEIFLKQAQNIVPVLKQKAESVAVIDMQDLFFRYTVSTFLEIGFGEAVDVFGDMEFARMFDLAQVEMSARFMSPLWKLERMLGLTEREKNIKHSIGYLNDFCYKCIKERRGDVQTHRNRDLVSRWIVEAQEAGEEATDSRLRDGMMNFLIAGRDTTACLLTWTLYRLAMHEDIQEQVVQEINDMAAGEAVSYEVAGKCKYMEAVLHEVLRLHPSVPADSKYAIGADTLPDGTKIPAGSTVQYRPYLFGRSALLWKEPLNFDPNRFMGEEKPTQYQFIAFNAGPRLCLGRSVALLEAKLLLCVLLQKFRFELKDKPEDVTYARSIILVVKGGLPMYARQRQ